MTDVLTTVVLVLLSLDVGQTLVVAVQHYLAWRRAPSGSGVLPLHVWLIALAHTCLVAAVFVLILDAGLLTALLLAGIGAVLTVVALHVLALVQRRRLGQRR